MAQGAKADIFNITSFLEGGENMEEYLEKSEDGKKFMLGFREGTSIIFYSRAIEDAQEKARKENEKKPVKVLAEMTPNQGAIPIDF